MRIFYGAGHEQFAPSDLLRHAQLAADAVSSSTARVLTGGSAWSREIAELVDDLDELGG
jgi:hypothetical protein